MVDNALLSAMEIQKDISNKINQSFIGKKLKVLVESIEGDYYIGRSYRDAPEVDGEVLIKNTNPDIIPGNFYSAEVYDNDDYDLYANFV